MNVSALVFFSRDLERARTFYADRLGLELHWIDGHDGRFLAGEAGPVSLVFLPGEQEAGGSPEVVFGIERDIHELVEELARHGVEIVTPVSEAPDGGLTADFLDPDGHVLSYHQPQS